jgi:hypothetical protein
MKSKTVCSRLLSLALCGAVLAGCDSMKDVRDDPTIPVPPAKAVLEGTVVGLGTARPVALRYNGTPNCLAPDPANPSTFVPADCRFYGAPGQSESGFSFGSLEVGTPYSITVQSAPFGKICSVANATGTVGTAGVAPMVTCENDPAVPRYDLTVNIAPAVQGLPNLTVKLASENGVVTQDATGLASVVFPAALVNTLTNLPAFEFKVTASTDATAGGVTTTNLCTFTPNAASFTIGGQNRTTPAAADTPEAVVVPTGPVSVTVNACSFAPTATVQYNGTPAQAMPAGGMTLALRNHFTGEDVQTLEVNAFTAGATTVAFSPVLAHSKALYELVVARQPAGQHCIVSGTTVVNADTNNTTAGAARNITAPTAGAVMLVDPAVADWWAYASRSVRCRAIPVVENRLTGTYQMDRRPGTQADTDPARPYGRAREFLTFFADGTFLYGINMNSASTGSGNANANPSTLVASPNDTFPNTSAQVIRNNFAASSGVTHGFYAYNSAAGTITFTVLTATSINPAGRGLNGMPGYAAGTGNVTATNVVKTVGPASTLSLTFTSGATTRVWTMTEPDSIPGEISGTWVTPDHRRAFAYNKGETYAFHMGVNGLGNLQDTCFLVIDGSTQVSGTITRHAGSATSTGGVFTCTPGILNLGAANVFARTPDLPHYVPKNSTPSGLGIGPTTPRIPPGFNGRFPGSASQLDNRPGSPILFDVVAGTGGAADTLTVQETLNGVPVNPPVLFVRERAN